MLIKQILLLLMPQMSQVLKERAAGKTAVMSIIVYALNNHVTTISHRQCHFPKSNQPHNQRPRLTSPAQDLHIRCLRLQDRLRLAASTADATNVLHNRRISAQIVRNCLRETNLRAHQGLDLTALCCQSRPKRANAHHRW